MPDFLYPPNAAVRWIEVVAVGPNATSLDAATKADRPVLPLRAPDARHQGRRACHWRFRQRLRLGRVEGCPPTERVRRFPLGTHASCYGLRARSAERNTRRRELRRQGWRGHRRSADVGALFFANVDVGQDLFESGRWRPVRADHRIGMSSGWPMLDGLPMRLINARSMKLFIDRFAGSVRDLGRCTPRLDSRQTCVMPSSALVEDTRRPASITSAKKMLGDLAAQFQRHRDDVFRWRIA